jgi:hypothetical protein
VASPCVNKSEFKETLLQVMKQAGMETELRNTVFHWVRSHSNHDTINGYSIKEPLAYLRKAQVSCNSNYMLFFFIRCLHHFFCIPLKEHLNGRVYEFHFLP